MRFITDAAFGGLPLVEVRSLYPFYKHVFHKLNGRLCASVLNIQGAKLWIATHTKSDKRQDWGK